MKRRRTVLGGINFFLLIAAVVTVAMLLYTFVDIKSEGNRLEISLFMLFVIIFLALICTFLDFLRRKKMVDEPVKKILDMTERLTTGDFSARIKAQNSFPKDSGFDVIAERLNLMAEELGKSELLKTDFISNVSHEIKTPLSIIRSYAELLGKEADGEKRKKYAEILRAASDRINTLVTNVLKLNKLEHEKILPEKERVNLAESLAETILSFEDRIEQKSLKIEIDFQENVYVLSVAGYLELVWNNLISNAVKFTDEGGMVAVKLFTDGKKAVVRIADTGCGIPAETGKRIFDKFYQGDTSHAQEGNGLGLPLVKRVIDILGGEISVESEFGKGSTFTIILRDVVTK